MIKSGDTIGILALGGNCDEAMLQVAVNNLENYGYKIKLAKNIYDKSDYLAGSDEDKLKELYNFFSDSEIKLILNARGGYGSLRLVNKIDYDYIKSFKKPFCGYSDITALLLMLYKKCDMVTFHGPMLCSDFVDINQFTLENFYKALKGCELEFKGLQHSVNEDVRGILWGGNLSTVVSLAGLDFIPNEDFIFFAEDLNEPVYKIDKMFTQLFNIDKFKKYCKGIVLGEFLNVDNDEWLNNFFNTLKLPTASGFKITHSAEKITIPIGRKAVLDYNLLKVL